MTTKLYVGNLSYGTTEDQLKEVFSQIGEVESVVLVTDRYSGESKGFAFVEMAKEEEARAAIDQVNGTVIDGRTVKVSEARPREDRRSSGRGFAPRSSAGSRGRSSGLQSRSRRR